MWNECQFSGCDDNANGVFYHEKDYRRNTFGIVRGAMISDLKMIWNLKRI
jgi:hypothetical protein